MLDRPEDRLPVVAGRWKVDIHLTKASRTNLGLIGVDRRCRNRADRDGEAVLRFTLPKVPHGNVQHDRLTTPIGGERGARRGVSIGQRAMLDRPRDRLPVSGRWKVDVHLAIAGRANVGLVGVDRRCRNRADRDGDAVLRFTLPKVPHGNVQHDRLTTPIGDERGARRVGSIGKRAMIDRPRDRLPVSGRWKVDVHLAVAGRANVGLVGVDRRRGDGADRDRYAALRWAAVRIRNRDGHDDGQTAAIGLKGNAMPRGSGCDRSVLDSPGDRRVIG